MTAIYDRLYIGGLFKTVNGVVTCKNLAAVELAGNGRKGRLDAAWPRTQGSPSRSKRCAGPAPTKMDLGVVSGTLLTGGMILALQTHIKFERTADGKLTWKIEKKPTSNTLFAPLLRKLLSVIK